MARRREPGDWDRDRAEAAPVERQVYRALAAHPAVRGLSDNTSRTDALDFEFLLDGRRVRVDVKEKKRSSSAEVAALWPEVPPDELFVLDETAFRALVWPEGMGYVLIHDRPRRRWHVLGPWELLLGPRRRFERLGDKGAGPFQKGKLLIDLRTTAEATAQLSIDGLVRVVRSSERARTLVRAFPVPGQAALPVVPRAEPTPPAARPVPPGDIAGDDRWGGLDAHLVEAVKQAWGWDEPTAVQGRAIPHVLAQDNVLIIAPTAGGKTEAALLPLLDIRARCGWAAPSIVTISPLKALLDDQLPRYRAAAALAAVSVTAMHGDVAPAQKRSFSSEPTDILLTTPESLERLLSQPGSDARKQLRHLRAVVVDEVHALVGTPRGAQLAALLERLEQLADADLQRVGLSATVGGPEDVLAWLAGGSLRDCHVVQARQPMKGEELAIAGYESVPEAGVLIGDAVAGRRALVFTSSRHRAEQLAAVLGAPVHHSSVAADGRASAIEALVAGTSGCLIATSGLEMGLDIGDVELVVNDGAPTGPGAYLQRLGRSGRRDGNRRMLITVGDPDSLLLALAAVAGSRRGKMDPVPPGRGARLVIGQQALLLAFQRLSYTATELREHLRFSPLFRPLMDDIDATVAHLVANEWLARVGGGDDLVVGHAGHARFGGRGFIDLLATFEGNRGAAVVDGEGRPVGTLDWDEVTDSRGRLRAGTLSLAGSRWRLTGVDRAAGSVTALPATGGADVGRVPSWRGPAREVSRSTWETAREILCATDVAAAMDDRARRWLDELRRTWSPRLAQPLRTEGSGTVIDAFAGSAVHRAVLAALGRDGTADGPSIRIEAPLREVRAAARRLLADPDGVFEAEARRQSSRLAVRHAQLVAPSVLLAEARQYHVDRDGITRTLELAAEWRT